MNTESSNTPAVRINGGLMLNYQHQKAILMGFVTKMDTDGRRATIKTTDDQFVQLVFVQPLNFVLQQNQLVEAYGTVSGRNQFQVEKLSHFMPDVSETFDSRAYNQAIQYFLNHSHRFNLTTAPEEEPVLKTLNNDFSINWKGENNGLNASMNTSMSDFN